MEKIKDYEKLFNIFIKDIPIHKDSFLYGISFIGPPGIGKSTVAKMISKN